MEKNYWIHRISHLSELSYPLLKDGYLTYGFSDFAVIDNYISNLKSKGWKYLDDTMRNEWTGLHRSRYQLWRYICDMKLGDWVIVPTSGAFGIYEIVEDDPLTIGNIPKDYKIYDWNRNLRERNEKGFIVNEKGKIIDLGFARKVKLIADGISRYNYADSALSSRLKVRQTNVKITDIKESVLKALDSHQNNKPINFRNELSEITTQINSKIQDILQPDKFEYLIKWFFKRIGASSVDIPSKNSSNKQDYEDVDVVASFELLKTVYYIQAKHHKGHTSSWALEQINAMKAIHENDRMDDGYSKIYWVISSADNFSTECINRANEVNVQLINGSQFAEMLLDAGFHNINKAF